MVLPALLPLLLACAARKDLRTGDEWMARGNYEAAVRAYTRADAARPDHPRVQARLAQALVQAGRYAEALDPAQAALDAGLEGSRADLARAHLELGDPTQALAAAQAGEPTPALELVVGEALLALGRRDEALAPLTRAWEGGLGQARVLVAWTQARGGDPEAATRTLAGLDQDPAVAPELLALAAGVSLAWNDPTAGQLFAEAALGLDAGLKAPEGWCDQSLTRAEALLAAGDRERALLLGSAAWALRPDDATVSARLGPWWIADGGLSQAIFLLARALETPPYALDAGRTLTQIRTGTPLSEAEVLGARVKVAVQLADAWERAGEPREAARALQLALDASPPDRAALLLRQSRLWTAAGEPTPATAALQDAARAGSVEAAAQLSAASLAQGDRNQAVQWGLIGWRQHPGDPDAALCLAQAYEARGERSAAAQVVKEALSAHPDHTGLAEALSRLEAPVRVPLPEVFRPQ